MIEKLELLLEEITDARCTITERNNGDYELWISWYSNAGEDCNEYICFDGTFADLAKQLRHFNEEYPDRCEENAKLWLGGRGAPDMFTLVEDAKDKAETFDKWTREICRRLEK